MITMHTLNLIALYAIYGALCLGIIGAAVCRINLTTPKRHKRAWAAMYILMAAYAGGELADVLTTGQWMATHELAGLIGIALNLALTHHHWRAGPPAIVCKE